MSFQWFHTAELVETNMRDTIAPGQTHSGRELKTGCYYWLGFIIESYLDFLLDTSLICVRILSEYSGTVPSLVGLRNSA